MLRVKCTHIKNTRKYNCIIQITFPLSIGLTSVYISPRSIRQKLHIECEQLIEDTHFSLLISRKKLYKFPLALKNYPKK